MFKKYNSIENHYRDVFLRKIRQTVGEVEWIVTEKIHGTNLSFLCDGNTVQVCKRSGPIGSDKESASGFFRADIALDKYGPAVLSLFRHMSETNPSLTSIQIFGEWAGGGANGTKRIQKEVFYCEEPEFFAFDVAFSDAGGTKYLSWDEMTWLLRGSFLFPPTIKRTYSFDDALATENKFNSVVPLFFGQAPQFENIVEGVVIKPNEPIFLACGSRVILKSKNDKFKEKDSTKKEKLVVEFSTELNHALNLAESLMTEARVNNVISKIGADLKPNVYIGPFAQDVVDDLFKELDDEDVILSDDDKKLLKKNIARIAAPFVMKYV